MNDPDTPPLRLDPAGIGAVVADNGDIDDEDEEVIVIDIDEDYRDRVTRTWWLPPL